MTRDEFHALLRNDLSIFTERTFIELHPDVSFLPNWHIDLIAHKMQSVFEGKIRRLIITVPRRYLKSIIASVAGPAFWLGRYPEARLLTVSYSPELAFGFAQSSRRIMESPFYLDLFGRLLSPRKNAVNEYHTIRGGFRISVPVFGAITGRGADVIIIDDPVKAEDALSDARRNDVNEWFRGTLYNRQNDKNRSGIVIIMQRLHEDDLAGFVQQFEGWEVINLPAIAPVDETITWHSPLGPRRFVRTQGSVLHPERESTLTLEEIRATMGTYNFQAQYLQDPAPRGGGMIQLEWFSRFDLEYLKQFDRIVQSWDTANKASELANYSVCTTWGIKDGKIYLIDVFRARMDYPELKKKVHELHDRYKPNTILIEDKASGQQLIQELRRERIYSIHEIVPKGDKVIRMFGQTGLLESRVVHLPKSAPWLDDYHHELAAFPRGRFDDQVDSTSQALEFIKNMPQEPNAVRFYREELEKRGIRVPSI